MLIGWIVVCVMILLTMKALRSHSKKVILFIRNVLKNIILYSFVIFGMLYGCHHNAQVNNNGVGSFQSLYELAGMIDAAVFSFLGFIIGYVLQVIIRYIFQWISKSLRRKQN